MPQCPSVSPLHLLHRYCELTSSVLPDTPLLRALQVPFPPLSADRIGTLTKEVFDELGVPSRIWQAHSTRAAGVLLYKELGLRS